ncbi:CYSTM domain-containing protein [Rhizoctonia solani AG-1 IA]|uniref:CYSTM domain-containing protein n=1 Tax=Thanatephorus cucumeris (strain AG1-IA) TaxID=983506 RepID=L8WHM7_THACA|nr:CYSTM domain-containing protein [Rhizoctonia solani AG-1 IA]
MDTTKPIHVAEEPKPSAEMKADTNESSKESNKKMKGGKSSTAYSSPAAVDGFCTSLAAALCCLCQGATSLDVMVLSRRLLKARRLLPDELVILCIDASWVVCRWDMQKGTISGCIPGQYEVHHDPVIYNLLGM